MPLQERRQAAALQRVLPRETTPKAFRVEARLEPLTILLRESSSSRIASSAT
jgi:hypothetical protein